MHAQFKISRIPLRLPKKLSIANFHPQNFAMRRPCLLCMEATSSEFFCFYSGILVIQLLAFNPGGGEINDKTKSNLFPICSTNTDIHSFQGNKG